MLTGKHPACAAKAVGNFLKDQQGPMPVTRIAYPLPVIRRRDEGCAAHGLGDHGVELIERDHHHAVIIAENHVAGVDDDAAAIRGLSVAKRLLTRARTQYNVVPAQ